MSGEDESTSSGLILATERVIQKFLRDREAKAAAPEEPGTSIVNQVAEHPVRANPVKQTKTVEELATMIYQDLSQIEGCRRRRQGNGLRSQPMELFADIWRRCRPVRNRPSYRGFVMLSPIG